MTENKILQEYVDDVRTFLHQAGIDEPFFIAGGSVFSIINGNSEYDDIDVYFYDQRVIETVKVKFFNFADFKTDNSFSFESNIEEITCDEFIPDNTLKIKEYKWDNQKKLQLVTKIVGTPEQVFSTFDFNCSRCAYTSSNEVVLDETYTPEIEFNTSNLSADILNRYVKYTENKTAFDKNNRTLYIIYDALLADIFQMFDNYYNNTKDIAAYTVLDIEIYRLNKLKDYEKVRYIHDGLYTLYSSDVLIDLYTKKMSSMVLTKITKPCDELILARIEQENTFILPDCSAFGECAQKKNEPLYAPDEEQRIRIKYAERFI